MLRFVDLRWQGICARFAFYNTVVDKFVNIGGTETWETFNEFVDDLVEYEQSETSGLYINQSIDIFSELCPAWVNNDPTESRVGWR